MQSGHTDEPLPRLPLPGLPVQRQPAVAARTRTLLALLWAGLVFSLIGAGSALMASRTLLRFDETSRLWPMVGNLASVLLALVCAGQLYVWRQAQLEWTGVRDVALANLVAPSAFGRWVALLCGVAGPLACLQVSRQTAPAEQAHWWAVAGGVTMILAMAFGGIHQFNPAGPRGVLPQRLRGGRVVTADDEVHVDPEADTVVLRRGEPDAAGGQLPSL
ncbi:MULTISPECIES: hypothetical protein [unclassified Luteococcus]|uniref:hypothetical protein n=1 Tax=unclassified Luteococcus TaxID=2639923 RepID=UPI00313CBA41